MWTCKTMSINPFHWASRWGLFVSIVDMGLALAASTLLQGDSDAHPSVSPGLGESCFLHQERGKEFSLEGKGQLDYFCPFSRGTEISPNPLSLFSLKAGAQGTLPILICLFFSLSFHYSFSFTELLFVPAWGGRKENRWGDVGAGSRCSSPSSAMWGRDRRASCLCSERPWPPAGTSMHLDLIWVAPRLWFAVYSSTCWEGPNLSKLSQKPVREN